MSEHTEPTCPTGKRVYLAWSHADHDAVQLRRKGKRPNARPYHCTTCHHTHVGGAL